MDFGERLRALREEKGLTQEELGKLLNVRKANISKYENAKLQPSIESLRLLADYFTVTLDYLTGRSDLKHGRVVAKSELKTFLPEDVVDKISYEIRVEELGLKEETKREIINILKRDGYL